MSNYDTGRYLPWFKVWSKGVLDGSITGTLSLAEQAVWWRILALVNELRARNGRLEYAPGIPIPRDVLAGRISVPRDILEETITKCLADTNHNGRGSRLMDDNGTLVVSNWPRYQGDGKMHMAKEDTPVILCSECGCELWTAPSRNRGICAECEMKRGK